MNEDFKNLVSDLKHYYSLTQAQIADRLGLSRPYISDVISGRAPFSDSLRSKIENTFPDFFRDDEDGGGYESVPLIPVMAQAGHLADFSNAVGELDCDRIVSPVKGVDLAIPVYGDSMSPEYPNGSIVFVKKNHDAFIEWGKAYVLDTVNGTVIKYLSPGEEGKVKCISCNPAPMYAPFEVSMEDIIGVYRVVLCMAMK